MDEKEDNTIYKVVLNHEEQYFMWPHTLASATAMSARHFQAMGGNP